MEEFKLETNLSNEIIFDYVSLSEPQGTNII